MNRLTTPAVGDNRWPPAIAVLCLLMAGVLIAYRDTGLAMVAIWSRSDTFAHAFLVPPIVMWLVWRKRVELAAVAPRPTAWMLLPIGVASLAWLIGDLAATNAVAQLAFTALLVFVVVAVLGWRASRVIAFPLAFLFFSVPVGEFVMPQMMQWTADFTVMALRLTGIPVYREGLQFVVPSGSWSVMEACSGIRYLIASIMVGALFAYLNYRTLRRRLIFVAVSAVVPIVANWVRAYLIVLIGDISGNVAAVSADHIIYGWVFFAIVITLMFMIGSRWTEPAPVAPATVRHAASVPTPPARGASAVLPIALGALVLLVLPHLGLRAMVAAERPGVPAFGAPPALADGWQLQEDTPPTWSPAFRGAAAEFNRVYAKGAERVGLYVGYYRHQDYAHKLVSSENRLVTAHESDWSAIGTGSHTVSVDGAPLRLRTDLLRGAGHLSNDTTASRLQVWRTYWINGTLTADDTWATVCIAVRKLMGQGDDAAVIMAYRPGADGDPDDPLLASFIASNLGALSQTLARTRDAAPPALAELVPTPASP